MKKFSTFLAVLIAAFATVAVSFKFGACTALAFAFILGALSVRHADLPAMGCLCDPTLIIPILTGKVFEAFKKKTIGLDFFSTDFGRSASGFTDPVKFGQKVISQLALIPSVSRATPGGLLSNSQKAKDLVTDLEVAVDRMAAVKVRLPSEDIQQLLSMPAFIQALAEAGMGLGRFVVRDALGEAASARNFTNSIPAAAPDLDTLETARAQLNTQGALEPRYGVGTTPFMGKIGGDPRVLYTYGYNQKVGGEAYAQFDNIKGFSTLREMPSFPTGNRALATVTADAGANTLVIASLLSASDGIDVQAIDPQFDIYNGARVRVSSTGNIPAGLAALTDYFIRDYAPDGANGGVGGSGVSGTFKLAATLGGNAIDITDAGTGTITITQAENLEAFLFERRAIHIATRPMIDPVEAAQKFGIPQSIRVDRVTDPDTGLDFLIFIWQDTAGANPSLDVFATFVVQYGIRAGRGIQSISADPTSFAANTGMDRAGLRVVTA